MQFKRLTNILLAMTVLSIITGSLLTPTVTALEDDINTFSLDEYTKDVDMDESVEYMWGIYNNGTCSHLVFVEVTPGDNGWTAEAETPYFEIGPSEFVTIVLTVTAPNTRDYPTHDFGVSLIITDLELDQSWTVYLGTPSTEITGGAYAPPTKALGFIPNFFDGVESLDNEWGVFLVSILFWLFIGVIIFFVLDPIVKQLTKTTETELDDQILAIVKGPVFGLIVAYGVVSSLSVLNLSWSIIHNLELLFSFLVIILVAWIAYKIFKDVLLYWGKAYAEKSETTLDDVMLPLFEKLGLIIVFAVAIIAMLNLIGVDVTMLVAGMGIMGLVIAFAAQDTLGNFISGMFLLTDRPFKVGDLVLMENGDYCRVDHVGMRSTKLYNTFDHDMIVLPNSKIANEKVINLTEPDNRMKVRVPIGVSYDSDLKKAQDIMLQVALDNPDVMKEEGREPFVRLTEFADSAITLKVYTWVFHLDDQWRVAHELRSEIFRRFNEEGIEIPFPQRVIHMEDGKKEQLTRPGSTQGPRQSPKPP